MQLDCKHTVFLTVPEGVISETSHSWLTKPLLEQVLHCSGVIYTRETLRLKKVNCLHFG